MKKMKAREDHNWRELFNKFDNSRPDFRIRSQVLFVHPFPSNDSTEKEKRAAEESTFKTLL